MPTRKSSRTRSREQPAIQPLALTLGEPAGIGPDITLLAWAARLERRLPPFVVLGSERVLADRATQLRKRVPLQRVTSMTEGVAAFAHALPVLDIPLTASIEPGRPEPASACATIAAIEQSVALVADGAAAAVVTNPIAKHVLIAAGFRHPGHTEFLAELAQQRWGKPVHPVMMIASDALRVVPLTIHLPLAKVPGVITRELLIDCIRIVDRDLRRDLELTKPRIAIAGLNPHAGENGTLGDEERRILEPAIAELQAKGLSVTGPHSADTLFHAAARSRYDVAIGMYHDQVLVPVKTLAFDTGVNVTLGLPFVRTSPDHGTAFDIAGTGKASPESLIRALVMAAAMAANRRAAAAGPA